MICWWVGLCSLPVSCLAWGDSAWGLWSLSGSWWPPRGFMSRGTFQDCCCQHPVPVVSPCLPVPPQETLPHQLAVSVQSPVWFGSVFFCMLLCTGFCLCPPRLESLLSPVLWKSYNQTCWPSSSDSLGIPSSFIGSQAVKPDVGFRTFTTVGELLWYYCSPVCGSPTQQIRYLIFHDCTPPTVSLQLLLCLWMWCIFFWWVPAFSCWWLFNS